jgi:hypothetical protein
MSPSFRFFNICPEQTHIMSHLDTRQSSLIVRRMNNVSVYPPHLLRSYLPVIVANFVQWYPRHLIAHPQKFVNYLPSAPVHGKIK